MCPDCGHLVSEHIGDLEIGLMCSVDECGCVGLANDETAVFRPTPPRRSQGA